MLHKLMVHQRILYRSNTTLLVICDIQDVIDTLLQPIKFLAIAMPVFSLQSAMIHNPDMQHFRYNPYTKVLTRERYDTPKMHGIRK